jgi:hypothetical protein
MAENIFSFKGDAKTLDNHMDNKSLLKVPNEILQFEAQAKPGLGAHGQAVRFPDQSEKDIEDQLEVLKTKCIFK